MKALTLAAKAWLVVAVIGQLIFATYVAGFYGRMALQGRMQDWNKGMPHGYVAGDSLGNTVVVLHVLFTTLVILGGALQLLPQLRQRAPQLHRWNGRFYLLGVTVLAVGGLIMVWTRGTVGGLTQHLSLSLNAVLILAFAALALHHARARRIEQHKRWALRLFLAVSGVWFFRVGLLFWLIVNQGPRGFDPETFTGPFLTFLGVAQYALPLLMLELYFRVKDQAARRASLPPAPSLAHDAAARPATWPGNRSMPDRPALVLAGSLWLMTVATSVGIVAAALVMWLPRVLK